MMAYRVELKRVEAQPIAVVRRRADPSRLATVVPEACGEVWAFVRSARVENAGRHIAVYLDGEINLEVGVEVAAPISENGVVINSATPAGMVATAEHVGPYSRLGEAHGAIVSWCAENQLRIVGPNWEIYGHGNDPTGPRTDVLYRVEGEIPARS